MLGLKLNHVSKRGPRYLHCDVAFPIVIACYCDVLRKDYIYHWILFVYIIQPFGSNCHVTCKKIYSWIVICVVWFIPKHVDTSLKLCSWKCHCTWVTHRVYPAEKSIVSKYGHINTISIGNWRLSMGTSPMWKAVNRNGGYRIHIVI